MKLETALEESSVVVRQRHGFTIMIEQVAEGYHVSFAEDGCTPHFEETYTSLTVVRSLFSETCSWRPFRPDGILDFPTRTPSYQIPYTRVQVERFWAKVDRTDDPIACWMWTGNRNTSSGFGIARTEKGRMLAHRVAWELTHGVQLATDEYILHLSVDEGCGNILCVRPDHLYLTRERRITRHSGIDIVHEGDVKTA